MSTYVNVALPLPLRKLFTYLSTDDGTLERGMRVLVPFGSKVYTGVVVELNAPPHPDAKPIIEVLDESTPAIPLSILELTRWMADYYLCSWGEALAAALPRELAPRSTVRVRILRLPRSDELTALERRAPKRAELLRLLAEQRKPLSIAYLERQLSSTTITAQLEALEQAGYIELQNSVERYFSPQFEAHLDLAPALYDEAELGAVLTQLQHRAVQQARALATVAEHCHKYRSPIAWDEVLALSSVRPTALKALVAKGYLAESMQERSRYHNDSEQKLSPTRCELDHPLTEEQTHAVKRICEALDIGKTKTFLLHGVTGSGKTIVYMHVIKRVLEQGKSAIVLVPEISLTPQLIDRFQAVFGRIVITFHSRMSSGERFDAWRAIRSGKARVVLGPRSAVFAPLDRVGIIIVDEEHEASYKQESPTPRYNGRDAAIVRGHIEQTVVVLGSATPSLESMYNASTARYHLLELTQRADGAYLPDIIVVDLRLERQHGTLQGRFSQLLLDLIVDRLQRKEGILLLHNRRGFAPCLECPECGYIPHCRHCNVALTYHKRNAQLRCHYCGAHYTVPKQCPTCNNPNFVALGAGTQRIEDELTELLKQKSLSAVITRVDTDATSAKDSLRRILHNFVLGRIDILVGTQMIAKGLDIGRVTLVGVINADIQMYLPDFRASERTLQILTQVAGRAGRRADHHGVVVIQTAHPDHIAINCTRLYRYDLFYHDELQERREANYPPFSRFVLVEFSGNDQQLVERHAQAFAHYMPRGVESVVTLGPAKPSIDRIKGKYRRIVVIKGDKQYDPNGVELRRAILNAWAAYNERISSSSVRMSIDVDSQSTV